MTESDAVLLRDMGSVGHTLVLVSSHSHITSPTGVSNGSQIWMDFNIWPLSMSLISLPFELTSITSCFGYSRKLASVLTDFHIKLAISYIWLLWVIFCNKYFISIVFLRMNYYYYGDIQCFLSAPPWHQKSQLYWSRLSDNYVYFIHIKWTNAKIYTKKGENLICYHQTGLSQ